MNENPDLENLASSGVGKNATDADLRFAEIVLEKRFVSLAHVADILKQQQKIRDGEKRDPPPLGELLMKNGFLSVEHFLSAQELLDQTILEKKEAGNADLNYQGTTIRRRKVGNYTLKRKLAEGGMGEVYEAEDTRLKRRVALKMLRPGDSTSPEIVARLHREAKIAAQLTHPNIVPVHDVGSVTGPDSKETHYIAMDLIEGQTLTKVLQDPAADRKDLVKMVEKVARAVQYAHEKGVLHRDIKPANVMVDTEGTVFLTDFGLARADQFKSYLTRTAKVMGTPNYMAPEQAEGLVDEIGPRTDVYALGVILYEMLTGAPPFHDAHTPIDLFRRLKHSEPPRPSHVRKGVEKDLEIIALKAMEKEPSRRYTTAGELADDLARYLDGDSILARPASLHYRAWKKIRRRKAWAVTTLAIVAGSLVGTGLWIALEGTSEELHRAEERRDLEAKIKPLEKGIEEARAYFYVPGIDIRARLARVEASLEELEEVMSLPKNEGYGPGWRALGLGWFFAGDEFRAEECLEKAVGLVPGDAAVNYYLGRIYLNRSLQELYRPPAENNLDPGERQKKADSWAVKALKRLDTDASPWSATGGMQHHIAQVYRLVAKRDLEQVRERAAEGMKKFGAEMGAEEFLYLEAWASRGEERMAACEEALQRRPHFARVYFLRGMSFSRNGNLDQAIEDYTRAVEINPKYREAFNNRGLARGKKGDVDGAIEDFTQTILIYPDAAPAYVNRAGARIRKGDREGGMKDYEEALRINPKGASIYLSRAMILRKEGNREGASRDLDKAIECDNASFRAYFYRATFRREAGEVDGAIEDFGKHLEFAPPEAPMRNRVETMLKRLQDRRKRDQ